MGKRGRQTKVQKDNSPATHADSDSTMQPVVVAQQVDPAKEQRVLDDAAKRRYKLAKQLLLMKDLSPMLVTVTDPVQMNPTDDQAIDLSKSKDGSSSEKRKTSTKPAETAPNPSTSKPSKAIQSGESAKTATNGSSPQETTSAEAVGKPPDDVDPKETADKDIEKLPDIPDLNSTPENSEVVIGSAIVYDGQDTKTLCSDIRKLRASMNRTSKRFYEAHKECVRIRDEYYAKCMKHQQMATNIHIRETLSIKGRIQRPFTQVQSNLLYSSKLRSGKKIKVEQNAQDLHKQEQFAFKDDSYELMRQLARNAGTSEHEGKKHQKRNICMLQVFEERCAICGKYYKTKEGLKSHLAVHTKTYFRCKMCVLPARQFASEKAFRHHLQWHALGENYYVCDYVDAVIGQCNQKFEWPRQLKSHQLTHQPPSKPCRVHKNCDAIYTFEYERTKHEEKGKALRIFKCVPCNARFKDHYNRDIHMIKIHGSRSFGAVDPPPIHIVQKSKSGSAKNVTAAAASAAPSTEPMPPRHTSTEDEAPQVKSPPKKRRRKTKDITSSQLDTTSTAGHSSGSEYVPTTTEARHAYDSDFLPDIA